MGAKIKQRTTKGVEMKHCKKCVMPNTRPGITFNSDGVCAPCEAAERALAVDWDVRYAEWVELCDSHKDPNRPYDCIVPASGGKDSHVQVHRMLEQGMRPLIVSVGDWFGHTKAGEHNFKSMCSLGADSFLWRQDPALMREMVRITFLEAGCPTWPIDAAIYSVPLRVASMMGISLVVYGENIAYQYGGAGSVETPSALQQADNDVVKPFNDEWWAGHGIILPEWLKQPDPTGLNPIYMSYYFPWDGYDNAIEAEKLGFKTADGEWNREGCIENYDQIDSLGYMVHPWIKYPKYGHQRATDVASNWIRAGRITREEGAELVREHDHKIDPKAVDDFLEFTGISVDAFWGKINELYNRDLFDQVNEFFWRLKNPVWRIDDGIPRG